MPASREYRVYKETPLQKGDFWTLSQLFVSHTQIDGTMSAEQERIVFDRGDAAAVLLFNTDTHCVVLVEQFRAATLGKGRADGWSTEVAGGRRLLEAPAGGVEKRESPIVTAIREVKEETGYVVGKPEEGQAARDGELKLIAKFFPSPGASSELIYLYFAKVSNSMKAADAGASAKQDAARKEEDIAVTEMPVDQLFQLIRDHKIEDAKLLIGALYLQEELLQMGRRPLATRKVKYGLKDYPGVFIGYITGPIYGACNENAVSIWVNSENEDMVMDRFNGKTISASIRFLGAAKDSAGNLTEDTIAEDLANELGGQAPVKIGTVLTTVSGTLEATHGVHKILHVATVKGARLALDFTATLPARAAVPVGFRADPNDLELCVHNVLREADRSNQGSWRGFWRRLSRRPESTSILFPMIGAGDGGLPIEEVAPRLVRTAIGYLRARHGETSRKKCTINEVYFLAYTAAHKHALDAELKRHRGTVLEL